MLEMEHSYKYGLLDIQMRLPKAAPSATAHFNITFFLVLMLTTSMSIHCNWTIINATLLETCFILAIKRMRKNESRQLSFYDLWWKKTLLTEYTFQSTAYNKVSWNNQSKKYDAGNKHQLSCPVKTFHIAKTVLNFYSYITFSHIPVRNCKTVPVPFKN